MRIIELSCSKKPDFNSSEIEFQYLGERENGAHWSVKMATGFLMMVSHMLICKLLAAIFMAANKWPHLKMNSLHMLT